MILHLFSFLQKKSPSGAQNNPGSASNTQDSKAKRVEQPYDLRHLPVYVHKGRRSEKPSCPTVPSDAVYVCPLNVTNGMAGGGRKESERVNGDKKR